MSVRGLLVALATLLLAASSPAEGPVDALQPFPDGVPEVEPDPSLDPALADPVLDAFEEDIRTWGAEAFDASAALHEGLRAGLMGPRSEEGTNAVDVGIERLDVTLQVLMARRRLAQTRLHALGVVLDEGRLSRLQGLEERGARALRENVAPLLSAWVYRIERRVRLRELDEAFADAEALTGRMDSLAEAGVPSSYDEIRMVLIRLAFRFDRPDLVRDWAGRCGQHCGPELHDLLERSQRRVTGQQRVSVDPVGDLVAPSQEGRPLPREATPPYVPPPPEHLAFRLTATWVPGVGTGTYLGLPVKRLASGAVDMAIAPSPLACGVVRVARDRFDYETADATRRLARTRVEVGWCPRLLTTRVGPGALSLRAALGPGVSWGNTRVPPTYDDRERLVGWGIAARLEAPLRFGPVEIVPSLGAAPYGRATAWGLLPDRSDVAFVDRVHGGIGLSWGRRARR